MNRYTIEIANSPKYMDVLADSMMNEGNVISLFRDGFLIYLFTLQHIRWMKIELLITIFPLHQPAKT